MTTAIGVVITEHIEPEGFRTSGSLESFSAIRLTRMSMTL